MFNVSWWVYLNDYGVDYVLENLTQDNILEDYQKIFVPIVNSNHWTLFVFDLIDKSNENFEVRYYDSMGNANKKIQDKIIETFNVLQKKNKKTSIAWKSTNPVKTWKTKKNKIKTKFNNSNNNNHNNDENKKPKENEDTFLSNSTSILIPKRPSLVSDDLLGMNLKKIFLSIFRIQLFYFFFFKKFKALHPDIKNTPNNSISNIQNLSSNTNPLQSKSKNTSPLDNTEYPIPLQQNGFDCGMFLCKYAEAEMLDLDMTFAKDGFMDQQRIEMIHFLQQNRQKIRDQFFPTTTQQ